MSAIDPPSIRKVKALDESMGVPMAMYWTTEEVADWMEDIGFQKYRVGGHKKFTRLVHRNKKEKNS